MTKLTDEAKQENEQNRAKQKLESDIAKKNPAADEVSPTTKVVPSSPDPTDTNNPEMNPRVNPEAPTSDLRHQ